MIFKEIISSSSLLDEELNALRGGAASDTTIECASGKIGGLECDKGKIETDDAPMEAV